jgi:Sec-independent protein translocase protein TatA
MGSEMFGLGIWELVIIIIVVVLFVKPEDLPKFFRKVGKLYGELKRYNDEILVKFRTIDQQVKKPLTIITNELNKAQDPEEKSKVPADSHEDAIPGDGGKE